MNNAGRLAKVPSGRGGPGAAAPPGKSAKSSSALPSGLWSRMSSAIPGSNSERAPLRVQGVSWSCSRTSVAASCSDAGRNWLGAQIKTRPRPRPCSCSWPTPGTARRNDPASSPCRDASSRPACPGELLQTPVLGVLGPSDAARLDRRHRGLLRGDAPGLRARPALVREGGARPDQLATRLVKASQHRASAQGVLRRRGAVRRGLGC